MFLDMKHSSDKIKWEMYVASFSRKIKQEYVVVVVSSLTVGASESCSSRLILGYDRGLSKRNCPVAGLS